MHIITKNEMQKNLVFDFAYSDDPSIFSKVIFLDLLSGEDFIGNKKIITGYWEAPIGSYDLTFESFNEITYIIDGEIDFISKNKKSNVKKGDYYYCKIGEKFKIVIKKPVKMFLILYPIDSKNADIFRKKDN